MRKANNKLLKLFQTTNNAIEQLTNDTKTLTIKAISTKYDVGPDTIIRWFKILNIQKNDEVFKKSLTGRKRKKEPDEKITKNFLENLYHTQQKTQHEIAIITGLAKWTIQKLFQKYNIEPRNIGHHLPKDIKRKLNDELYLKNAYEKHGSAEKISQELNISTYPVYNALEKFDVERRHSELQIKELNKNSELRDILYKLHFIENKTLTDISKIYNNSVASISKWFQLFGLEPRQDIFTSCYEIEIIKWLSSKYSGQIVHREKEILKPHEIDIFLPELNVGIEFHGLYWHTENKINKNKHQKKADSAIAKNIKLFQIYENEWKNKKNICQSMILNSININDRILNARECNIQILTHENTKEFLNNNHLYGYLQSSVSLGAFFEEELVAIMTFNKAKFNPKYQWELARFANKLNYRIRGIASKLFSFFVRHYNPNSCLCYADKRFSTGKVYQQLGFTFLRSNEPNYGYVINNNIESRQKWQKHKLEAKLKIFDPALSEGANMANNGYYKIWDAGHNVYVWFPPTN